MLAGKGVIQSGEGGVIRAEEGTIKFSNVASSSDKFWNAKILST